MPRGSDLRVVLAERGFRLLLGTRLVGQASDGVLQAGLASYVLFSPERQASASAIAASFAVLLLPYSLVGPFTGVLIDRWRRRQIIVYANVVRGLLGVVLALMVASGVLGGGSGVLGAAFVCVALMTLGVNRFFLAALSAALPHVVQPGRLVTANALATTAGTVATALGAAAGLAVRFLAGGGDRASAAVVISAAGGYLLAAAAGSRLGRDRLGPDRPDPAAPLPPLDVRGEVRSLVSGVRYLRSRRPAWNALAALGVYRITFGLATVLVVLLQRGSFHAPSDADGGLRGVTATFVALAVGVPIGAVVTPAAVRRWGVGWWVPSVMVCTGVALGGLGLLFSPVPLAVAAFLLGLGGQAVKVSVDATVQRSVDDLHRGLVFALYDVLFNVAFVAAVATAAATAPDDGRSVPLMSFAGAVLALAGLWYARVTPRPARRDQLPADEPSRPAHQARSSASAASAPSGPRSIRRSSRKR
ncbi:MAG: MFS transporter [Actinomycetes bacterium]